MLWHSMDIEEVFRSLRTSPRGLSRGEAERRLLEYGPNEIRREKRRSSLSIFLEQFKSFLILILIAATVVSLLLGEYIDAIAIISIVFICALLGFLEEYRSEKAVEKLREMAAPTATVIRDGVESVVQARELVPGDVVVLRAGDRVPADIRLAEAFSLRVDESALTGESRPVSKSTEPLDESTPLPDRVNMAYSGTAVTYGHGWGVVVETGMRTELGKIAKMVQETERERTPLERRMEHVGKWLGALSLTVCAVIAALGVVRGHGVLEMLIWGVSLAIAAVPEALPAVVTGALAIGMREMAKRNAIVRRLPAVETLGCTTVICSDKTGTITKNEVTVRKVILLDMEVEVTGVGFRPSGELKASGAPVDLKRLWHLDMLVKAGALCSDAKLIKQGGSWHILGDPTEGALVVLAAKAGYSKEALDAKYRRVGEVPFTSERKRMTTVHEGDGRLLAFMKGAPEVVLERCSRAAVSSGVVELTPELKRRLLELNDKLASRAYRNLCIAYREVEPRGEYSEEIEEGFTLLGLVAMIDPPREEVREAIELCRRAGIKVVMITGDHKLTALAVASEIGLSGGRVVAGAELEKIDVEELAEQAEEVSVYARVSPEHKVKIVDALKSRGHVVAMTGDGVNDAPALKKADIGIAMGIKGTDVAKEASDMVLADDNFATIVAAVKEGRRIFDNIKKYLTYLLQCNIAEILVMLFSSLLNWELPLTAVQLLWINLTTDGLPALALGVDPAEPDVMDRPPRKPDEGVFTREVKAYLMSVPLLITALLLMLYWRHGGIATPKARTQLFTTMVFIELAVAATCRSLKHPVYRVGALKNMFLWAAIAVSAALQLAALYTPALYAVFDVQRPTLSDLALSAAFAVVVFAAIEGAKLFYELKSGRSSSQTLKG